MRFGTALGLLASLSVLSFAGGTRFIILIVRSILTYSIATEAGKPELVVQAFFPENVQSRTRFHYSELTSS